MYFCTLKSQDLHLRELLGIGRIKSEMGSDSNETLYEDLCST